MISLLDLDLLTEDQAAALTAIRHWYQHEARSKPVFRLFGYAGTGKTSLAQVVAREVVGDPDSVIFAAYTNKAVHVLRSKGCDNAGTIHRLIYRREYGHEVGNPIPENIIEIGPILEKPPLKWADEKPDFDVNWPKNRWALLVIDECSMVDYKTGMDLLHLDIPILALGDPAQLPPVSDDHVRPGFFMRGNPEGDYLLTEIVRQKPGDAIIELSTMARKGQRPPIGRHGDNSQVIWASQLTPKLLAEADQVIVGTHHARYQFNRVIRRFKGVDQGAVADWLPRPGEKLVCLKNEFKRQLYNGSLWTVVTVDYGEGEKTHIEVVQLGLVEDDNPSHKISVTVPVWLFNTPRRIPHLDNWDMFTYGYAMTCHKCQGSEWGNVVVIDQRYVFRDRPPIRFRNDEWKWLYTAITRAQKRLTIVAGWKQVYWLGLGIKP